ncbi:putative F-box domain-containing protein [Medicago truncatula]|uniref:F-box protein interaction domain protein n=1 Tax=Medicago truncatula TaxID=3880 RepID=G7LIC1_MEDTR|nr:putative F-box protein At3g16210 [Medicago truncatula]AET02478.1 F-box protein interaction domain protein [Medicago truncatula]RHN40375.1 putative F-box domain-containing protein [Medicago truncatula]
MAAKSQGEKKVRNHIPDDLVFSILSKLSLKPLKRFGCVRKTWALLLENPCFQTNFISIPHSYYDGTSLLLYEAVECLDYSLHCSFYLLSDERYENQVKLDFPNPFQEDNPFSDFYNCDFYGCDTFTGTLCLKQRNTLSLWNLTTHEFKVIPLSPIEFVPPYREASVDVHGFGYDYIKDDFKIIRYIQFTPISSGRLKRLNVQHEDVSWNEISYEPEWEIYSLRCNSWKKHDVNMPKRWCSGSYEPLYIDGLSHWWSVSENCDEHLLVSFDLSNEMFFTTTIPIDIPLDIDTNFHLGFVYRRLVVLNRSIASISWYLLDKTIFYISILGELGVKESWTKLFVVGPLPYIDRLIGAGKNGDIFFQKKDGKLVCFSLSTQKTEELGVKGAHFYDLAIYKKSFLSIGGINH